MTAPDFIDIDKALEALPDEVANELEKWRRATLDRQKVEALLTLQFKHENEERTMTHIKAMIQADASRYAAVLNELKAESNYVRLNERLLSFKKRAALRTSF